ncbi:MAG: nitrite/sulfite reductase [Crocinitomicaceae bacterium]
MQSFRTELENPVVEKDIIELENKIRLFKEGKVDDDSFRSLRLARGVYGQRQQGVQMVRIKLPLGSITPLQLKRIAEVSDTYSNGNLHLTTRQDIQIHYVSLDDTPQLWTELEEDEITLREACGNTVRNITASPYAGIDKDEPFDVTLYGWSLFEFFLRNPVGGEMGRKFKISLSASDKDLSRGYMHDLGVIPKIKDGQKGFKLLLGGGLGAQPHQAIVLKEFLLEVDLIAYAEAVVRVFDKFGERNKRNKARFKFLIQSEGADAIISKIEDEFSIVRNDFELIDKPVILNEISDQPVEGVQDFVAFEKWRKTNVIRQKQKGFVAVIVKIRNGNISSDQSRILADIMNDYSSDSARITIEQNILIRFVPERYLGNLYNRLVELGFADFGANAITDITACPGTDTCNLGITGTYVAASEIEKLMYAKYESIVLSGDINIKMSGCMNSCGQHSVSDIGFHGSTIKKDGSTYPALQVLLGGANYGNGESRFGDKVIKVPSKRVLSVIEIILDDYLNNRLDNEKFNAYYLRREKIYFYDLLKNVADVLGWRESQNEKHSELSREALEEDELLDWGAKQKFKPEIGIGECAGVKIDLVRTLLYEAYEKVEEGQYFIEQGKFRDAVYTAYSSLIQSAKSFLVKNGQKTNSKHQISEAFEAYYPQIQSKFLAPSFRELLNEKETNVDRKFAREYVQQAERFHLAIDELIKNNKDEK